jgi:hypothetical protein
MCGGPSPAQQSIATQQQQYYQTLQNSYQTTFANQQNVLNSLTASFQPILQAGINQYGFSPQENAALRSQATSGVAQQYQNASQATGNALAAMGGGNQFLPTGGAAQLQQQNALAAAQTESNQQLGITEAGYQQGTQNFLAAAQALGGVAQSENPTGVASVANQAGTSAYDSAKTNATQSAQMWAALGGGFGGLGAAALGKMGGGGGGGGSNSNSSGNGSSAGYPAGGSSASGQGGSI